MATMVAWNMAANHAMAEGEDSGANSSSYICAVSPANVDAAPGNFVGAFVFPGGGYIFLHHKDDDCYQESGDHHHKKRIYSTSQLYASALVPTKSPQSPWMLYPDGVLSGFEPNERNSFEIGADGIKRSGIKQISLRVISRELAGLPTGDSLFFKLEIKSVTREDYFVEVFGKAWLEGSTGGVTYGSASCAEGSGISMVVENSQDPHPARDCNVSL